MFGGSSGAGVGVGPGGSMGTRFGWYEQLLRDRVQRAWQPPHDPRQHASSPAIVTFEITRDGAARDVRILQRSGYYDFDMSAQRAIVEAAPFQPLPPGYDRNSARIEFWFEMKK